MSGQKGPGDGSVWPTGTGGEFPNRFALTAKIVNRFDPRCSHKVYPEIASLSF